MKLAILQNEFIDGIYDELSPNLLRSIKNGKAPRQELLDIYRNNLYSTLTNALRITYPKIYQITAEKKFKKLGEEFIKQNRSNGGNLDDYGENFTDFLAKKEENFLSDLAKLEWLLHRAYLAKDVALIDIEKLQKLAPEKLFDVKFKLHPSCFLISSNYNLLGKKKQVLPSKRKNYFLIYRHNLTINSEKISQNEFNFLNGVQENLSLYEIYEKYKIDIQFCLQKYLANGVLTDFLVSNCINNLN